MTLSKIQGHTYFFPGPTNIGVLKSKTGMGVLIDAGIDAAAGRALAQEIEAEGLKAKHLIITHAHPDHYGASKWLKEQYTGLIRYASEEEAVGMKYSTLESRSLYSAHPLHELEGRFLKGPSIEIDTFLNSGETEIGDKRVTILSLPGHTFAQIGVLTNDSVLFAGDSLFSEEIMEKYDFPFLLDIELQLQTISSLENLDVNYVVLSHGTKVYTSVKDLCEKNKGRIENYLNKILNWCCQPLTREDVTEKILLESEMEVDIPQYFMTLATTGAFLSYLTNKQQLYKCIISGKCYFYQE